MTKRPSPILKQLDETLITTNEISNIKAECSNDRGTIVNKLLIQLTEMNTKYGELAEKVNRYKRKIKK